MTQFQIDQFRSASVNTTDLQFAAIHAYLQGNCTEIVRGLTQKIKGCTLPDTLEMIISVDVNCGVYFALHEKMHIRVTRVLDNKFDVHLKTHDWYYIGCFTTCKKEQPEPINVFM
jgi:hypothetical protein